MPSLISASHADLQGMAAAGGSDAAEAQDICLDEPQAPQSLSGAWAPPLGPAAGLGGSGRAIGGQAGGGPSPAASRQPPVSKASAAP
jgi:hypothetical protein